MAQRYKPQIDSFMWHLLVLECFLFWEQGRCLYPFIVVIPHIDLLDSPRFHFFRRRREECSGKIRNPWSSTFPVSRKTFFRKLRPLQDCERRVEQSPQDKPGNAKGGSIPVPLTSCFTGLDQPVSQIKTKDLSCHTTDFKPVKQEVNVTVIFPLLVFPG